MERLVVLVCALVATVFSEPIDFKDCTGSGQMLSVDISPCPKQPCVFSFNNTATVKVTFKSPVDSSNLTAKIYGNTMGIKIGWPMPNPNGCKESNITCPVDNGKVYTYVATLGVPPGAPKIRLVVEWLMIGASGEKVFCFDFPMEIS